MYKAEGYDVIVIGAGHAGCEAALAAARMGCFTLVFVMNLDSVAMMPCNPNIGGTSKGHLVREIDALGGEMGRNIDKTYIQSRMLNLGKGPAVHSLRAQADKVMYSLEMKKTLENTPNLRMVQAEVTDIAVSSLSSLSSLSEGVSVVKGVVTASGAFYPCKALVVATGTYLNARCIWGEVSVASGPNGLASSSVLSSALQGLGIKMTRFNTSSPARIHAADVDFSKMVEHKGDEDIVPFSFENTAEGIKREEQVSCYLTHTNEKTHEIIRNNLHRSPLHLGKLKSPAPRYCASIEDKVKRFPDKPAHQVFVEPEGLNTQELYVSGMFTSLPEDVQIKMYQSVEGLENCHITRFGYAIEYDCIDASQLKATLEFKDIGGLFCAGQFNGSSGYEEAAAQGLIAGINAAALVLDKPPLVLDRSEAYIGVLIDDLVTKGVNEPYRMMTSRAEYRLLLRQDNADLRLTPRGYGYLIDSDRYHGVLEKERLIAEEIARLEKVTAAPSSIVNSLLRGHGTTEISAGFKMAELIRRPELSYEALAEIDPGRPLDLPADVKEQVNIAIKYEGYIRKQMLQVEQFKKLEGRKLPDDINYDEVRNLREEARQKLKAMRPANIGQASRIAGIGPADIANLMVYIRKMGN